MFAMFVAVFCAAFAAFDFYMYASTGRDYYLGFAIFMVLLFVVNLVIAGVAFRD